MIRITPYYEHWDADAIQRAYLRMIAASTPFRAKDIIYDDPDGLASCVEVPKRRMSKGGPTALAKLLRAKQVNDGSDAESQLEAEAELAEVVIEEYSKDLHSFLYKNGSVNQENLRKLLLLRMPNGKVPDEYRFDEKRNGPSSEWKERAKALYTYVFRYDDFSRLKSGDSHHGIHDFVAMLGVNVCPYCNRQFTTSVNLKDHKVRPQLDHFRNKHKYPFLALSINNLVPTCGVCNLLKLDKDNDLVYPYDEDFEMGGLVFRTTIPAEHTVPALEGIPISERDFRIKMEPREPGGAIADTERWERIQESEEELCLEDLYQSHRDYVSFLYRQRYILTKQLAQDLHIQFPGLFDTAEEVEQVLVLMHTDYGHWGDRPLAKLTHDILDEIEELYGSAGRL